MFKITFTSARVKSLCGIGVVFLCLCLLAMSIFAYQKRNDDLADVSIDQPAMYFEDGSTLYIDFGGAWPNETTEGVAQVRIAPVAGDKITAVSLEMVFDPAHIRVDEIDLADSPLRVVLQSPSIDTINGVVRLATGIPAQQPPMPVVDDALVAIINYTVLELSATEPLMLTNASVAAAVGKQGNVVRTRVPAAPQ